MKQTDALREKVNELELSITKEVDKFLDEVGECDINIEADLRWVIDENGQRFLSNTEIKVYVVV